MDTLTVTMPRHLFATLLSDIAQAIRQGDIGPVSFEGHAVTSATASQCFRDWNGELKRLGVQLNDLKHLIQTATTDVYTTHFRHYTNTLNEINTSHDYYLVGSTEALVWVEFRRQDLMK